MMDASTASEGPRFRSLAGAQRSEPEAFLPLVVFPRGPGRDVMAFGPELQRTVARYLPRLGAIVFRGFSVTEDADLARFLGALAEPGALRAKHGADPSGSQRAWFWCADLPDAARPLELFDCRELCRRIPGRIRQRWAARGVEYSRRFEPAALRRWLALMGFEPSHLALFCRQHGLACEWEPRGGVRLSRRCSPLGRHPQTGDESWSAPASGVPLPFESSFEPECEGWSLRHADGSALDVLEACEVAAAVESCRTTLPAQLGDVLLVDPWSVALALPADSRFFTLSDPSLRRGAA